ncbi:MAG: serine/threonine protein kinase [Planctomycetes bacterium]|nr:serine/threonine protein kinase [Planctomycetota bacterium]
MSTPDPTTVRGIFAAASEASPSEREAVLARLCGDDAALRAEVESLLEVDTDADWLAEDGIRALRGVLTAVDDRGGKELPAQLGAYRIEGLLGRGGVGVVYRARQQNPDRAIALKVLPPSSSADALRRFTLEQDSLARLQHPAIAQIYAAGSFDTDAGPQPFLAMELVDGRDLLTWQRAETPELRQRVELLIAICEAVHHAHQKGVVHRDLKPGNILVDAEGRPKVVDFGLARLLADDGDHATLTGQVLGTPAYMSPEQADGRADLIDTRTDVYALGVIGYQLFTERLPIDVVGEPITRAIRRIVEDQPVPLGQRAAALRGDLQNIVGRCLRKRPEERYSSAMALADDLRRYLAHEPVDAREPSALYVASRYVRRHRLLLAAAGVVIAALAIALWISVDANRVADDARAAAEAEATEARRQLDIRGAALRFLADAFELTDPGENPKARTMSTGEIFAAAAQTIGERFAGEPDVEREVRVAVGGLLLGLGEYEHAREQLEAARAIDAPWGDPWLAVILDSQLATVCDHLEQPARAIELLGAALREVDELEAAGRRCRETPQQVRTGLRFALGQSHFRLGDRREAERIWRAIVAEAEPDPDLADGSFASRARAGLATICAQDGRVAEAEALVRRAVAGLRAFDGADNTATLSAVNNLAGVLAAAGDTAGALQLFREVVGEFERVLGPGHLQVIEVTLNLAALEWQAGDKERAIAAMRELLAAAERDGFGDNLILAGPYSNLGKMLWDKKELDEAAGLYQRAIDIRLAQSPVSDVVLSGYYHDLARIRRDQGRAVEGLELERTSVRIRIEALGPLHPKVLPRRVALADLELHVAGDVDKALAELRAVDGVLVEVLGHGDYATPASQKLLVECMLAKGDIDAARTCFGRLEERAERYGRPEHWAPVLQKLRGRLAAAGGR